MMSMNEASLIKLREFLTVDGWAGFVSDLTSIIEKIEKNETIKKFIFFSKSRYEKSFKDIKKNKEDFLHLENDVM